MATNWSVLLRAELDKSGISSDLKTVQGILDRSTLKMMPKLEDQSIRNQLKSISSLIAQDLNKTYNLKVNSKDVLSALKTVEKEFGITEKQAKTLQNSLNMGKADFLNKTSTYLQRNTALSKELTAEIINIQQAVNRVDDASGLKNLEQQFKSVQLQAKATGKVGDSFGAKIRKDFGNFGTFLGVGTVTMQVINQIRNAFNEYVQIDSILTEISKTSNKTREELEYMADSAFEAASAWGSTATDYLTIMQEMNRSGFQGKAGEQMTDLATEVMLAGDLTADVAQKYILATNAAYGYAGNIDKLTQAFDAANVITNNYSVNMTDMAEATSIVGSLAANSGVGVNELSAAIGTLTATTKQSGSEVANALKAIFMNVTNLTSDKVVQFMDKINVSMIETKDGIEQMRTPIEILRDLQEVYNGLDTKDPLRTEMTTILGGKLRSSYLSSLLSNWDQFESQLEVAGNGMGSMAVEAEKSLDTIQSKLNILGNTFSDAIKNFLDTDMVKGFLDIVTQLVSAFDMLTQHVGGFGTVVGGIGLIELIRHFDELKTSIQSLKVIQSVANEINKIPVAINAANQALTPTTVDAYVKSLQGLDLKQAQIALSTSQLTDAQKAQILTQAGLISSNEAISAGMVQQALAQSGLTGAKQEEVLVNAGLMSSESGVITTSATCTKAKLEEALATAGISSANAQAIVSNTGLAASSTATSVSIGTLTASIKANIAAMATWMVSNPVGWLMLAGTAIFGAVKAFDALTVSLEEQKQTLKDTKEAFSESNEEVNKVTQELKENKKAMDELQSKPSLTYVDESELQKLKETTKELEKQEKIAQRKQEEAATDLGVETDKTFRKEFGNLERGAKNVADNPDYVYAASTASNDAIAIMPQIIGLQEQYKKELDNGNVDMANTISNTIAIMTENLKNGNYNDVLDTLSGYKQNLLSIMDYRDLTDEEQALYNEIESWQKNIYSLVNPNEWNAIEFDDIFNTEGIERTRDELIALAQAGQLTTESIAGFDNLNEAIQNSNLITAEGVSNTQEFIDQIVAYAQGAENAISEVVNEENQPTYGFILDEDSWKQIDAFTKNMGSFKQAISDASLSTEDLFSLMQSAPSDMWDDYLNGAVSLKDVLQDFSQGELEALSRQFPDLAGSMSKLFNETFGNAISSTQDLIGTLDTLSSSFKELQNAYDETAEDGFKSLSADAMSGLQQKFGNLEGWDQFFKTITEGNPTIEQTRQAISDLSNEYIDSCGLVQNLTEANKNYVIQQLEANGIVNAAEVVTSRLKGIQEQAAVAAGELAAANISAAYSATDLANMTGAEIGALYNELAAAGITSQALYDLATAKGWTNSVVVNTEGDQANLYAETGAANITQSALNNYGNAKIDSNGKVVQTGGDQSNLNALTGVTNTTQSSIVNYQNAKVNSNNATIKTSGDIANLSALSSAAVNTAANLANLNKVKAGAMNPATLKNNYGDKSKYDRNAANPMQDFLSKNGALGGSSGATSAPAPAPAPSNKKVSYGGGNASNGGGGARASYVSPSSNGSGGSKGGRGNGSKGGKGRGKGKGNGSGSGSNSSAQDTSTVIDWIETKLERLKSKTKKIMDSITDKISSSLKSRKLKSAMSAVNAEISGNEKAYTKYMDKANKVGLSKKYRDMVKNGSIKIETIKDEKLADKISQYKDYYEKAQDCKKAIDDLKESQQELYEQWYNMPNEVAEKKIESLSKKYELLEGKASVAELGGSAIAQLNNTAKASKARAKAYKDSAKKSADAAKRQQTSAKKQRDKDKKAADKAEKKEKKAKNKINTKKLSKTQKKQLKSGKTVSTKGLKGKDKKRVEAYNKALSKSKSADKRYSKSNRSYTSATKKYNSAASKYSSASQSYAVEAEFANMVSTYGGNSYQVQNKLLDDELNNLKAQNTQYKNAYTSTTKTLKSLASNKKKLDSQISKYQKKLLNTKGLSKSQKAAVKAGKTIDTKGLKGSALKNANAYNKSLKDRITTTNKYTACLEAQKTAADKAAQSQVDLAKSMVETAQAQFKNVQAYYEAKNSYLSGKTGYSDAVVKRAEALYGKASDTQYKWQIKDRENERKLLYEERNKLQAELDKSVKSGKIKAGTEEWFEMKNAIADCQNAIYDLDVEIDDLQDSLMEKDLFKQFEDAITKVDKLRDSMQSLSGLIDSGDNIYDENGKLNDLGLTKLYATLEDYNGVRKNIAEKQNEINELDNARRHGASNLSYNDYITKREELQKELQSLLSDAKSAQDNIIDLMTTQSQKELEVMQDVLDKRAELLKKKKEYYDYDKTLKSKDKELQQLKMKAAALADVTDAESLAEKKRLEAQIAEQEEDIQDTIQDHIYELQIDGLDELKTELSDSYTKYVEELATNFAEIKNLINDATHTVTNSAEDINKTIAKILKSYGVDPVMAGIPGFANGGLVEQVRKNGDTGIASLKHGEYVLDEDLTNLARNTLPQLTAISNNPMLKSLANATPGVISNENISTGDVTIHYDNMINIESGGIADVVTLKKLQSMMPEISEKVRKDIVSDRRKSR